MNVPFPLLDTFAYNIYIQWLSHCYVLFFCCCIQSVKTLIRLVKNGVILSEKYNFQKLDQRFRHTHMRTHTGTTIPTHTNTQTHTHKYPLRCRPNKWTVWQNCLQMHTALLLYYSILSALDRYFFPCYSMLDCYVPCFQILHTYVI